MKQQEISVRQATEADLESVTHLFRESILNINSMDYAAEQTIVWAAAWQNRGDWLNKIRNQHFLLAYSEGKLAGFGSVERSGYLDMLYVGKDFQRKGVATALFDELENYASQQGIDKIFAQVSITARPFFERNGFTVEKEQRKMLNDVEFINYRMKKSLP